MMRAFPAGTFRSAMPPHDFILPTADEEELNFNADFRAQQNTLLCWYRGHW